MTLYSVSITLTASALTGWLIFRLLLSLLFHPGQPLNLAGFRWQGLLPALRPQLVDKLGNWIQTKAIPQLKLQEKISDPANIEKLLPLIEVHIDDFLQHKLTKEMPMISMFIGEKTIGKLKETFLNEIALMLPKLLQSYAQNMEQQLDLRPLITKVISEYPDQELEKLFKKKFAKQIRFGGVVAALIGLLIGLLQVLLLGMIP